MAWLFAAINIEPGWCMSVEMVKAHYPSVQLSSGPTGHSVDETFGWNVRYDWGALRFGTGQRRLPSTIALEPADAPRPDDVAASRRRLAACMGQT